jgi:ATP-dependent helicase HrpA
VTLDVPIEALNQVAPEPLGWLVPGLMKEKVLALIRSLPKSLRTRFVPAPETADRVVPLLRFGEGSIHAAVAAALGHLGGISVPPDAFQDERLPLELRMNVRVTDAEGRLLASGRDLEAIRRELGAQAAESFSQLDDPHWNRDGLTDWDFDDLPAEVELPRGRLSVKGYPALLDRDGAVSLRLVDSLQRAEHETRFGLRRLCLLAARRELKSQVDWLPNLDRMQVYAATLPGFDLRGQLVELLADRAMVADQPTPRSKDDYQRLLAAGRERIGWAAQEVLSVAWPLYEGYHQACLAVEQFGNNPTAALKLAPLVGGDSSRRLKAESGRNRRLESPPTKASDAPRWQYALDDIREQIAWLMEPGSFSKTAW